jgi:hypothetical protein
VRKAASVKLMIVSNLEFARLGFIERNAFKSVDLHYDSERTVSRPRDPGLFCSQCFSGIDPASAPGRSGASQKAGDSDDP